MKKLIFSCALAIIMCTSAKAQSIPTETPTDFFGFGLGSNTSGVLGVTYEHLFKEHIGVYGSAGLGLWGYRLGVGGRLYLRNAYSGSFAAGIVYSTGANGAKSQLSVIEGTQTVTKEVTYDAHPVTNFNLSYTKFWKMGKKSRFHLEAGYSIPLNGKSADNYTIVSPPGAKLDKNSQDALLFVQPGGLILGIGFTFGLL